MKSTNLSTREKILKKIRGTLLKSKLQPHIPDPNLKSSIFKSSDDSLPAIFAKEFNKNSGRFIYCKDEKNFIFQYKQLVQANDWKNIFCTEKFLQEILKTTKFRFHKNIDNFDNADVGITSCEALVARTGSIIVSSGRDSTRILSIFPPTHLVIAYHDQIFFDLTNAYNFLKDKYSNNFPSMISLISGPSRTADIEKTLVLGAHGPKDIYCFYINER